MAEETPNPPEEEAAPSEEEAAPSEKSAAPETSTPTVSPALPVTNGAATLDAPPSADALEMQPPSVEADKLEIGEWVSYDPGNGHKRPAMITDLNEDNDTLSLMVVYKGHIDFISEVSSDDKSPVSEDDGAEV